jgi:hypothetical protein
VREADREDDLYRIVRINDMISQLNGIIVKKIYRSYLGSFGCFFGRSVCCSLITLLVMAIARRMMNMSPDSQHINGYAQPSERTSWRHSTGREWGQKIMSING